jgi:hypothetical protein
MPYKTQLRKPCQNRYESPVKIAIRKPCRKIITGLSGYETCENFSLPIDTPPLTPVGLVAMHTGFLSKNIYKRHSIFPFGASIQAQSTD